MLFRLAAPVLLVAATGIAGECLQIRRLSRLPAAKRPAVLPPLILPPKDRSFAP
jgi:hypothetical protein